MRAMDFLVSGANLKVEGEFQAIPLESADSAFEEGLAVLKQGEPGAITRRISEVDVEVEIVTDFKKVLEDADRVSLFFPVLEGADYSYKRPIEVILHAREGSAGVVAVSEDMERYALGATRDEALEAFEDRVISDFRNLRASNPDELSEDAKEALSSYESHFEFNGG